MDGAKSRSLEAAAKQAVEALSKRCYTIKVKNKYLGDGTAVDNVDLNEEGGGGGGGGGALGSDNVGHRLLRLMGWSGGGLGKGGAGISEPVTATAMANRYFIVVLIGGRGGVILQIIKSCALGRASVPARQTASSNVESAR